MKFLDFKHESHYEGVIAGIDEAGRGPWAGPVVAAAVIFRERKPLMGIHDSKQLKKPQREAMFEVIMQEAVVGVGICSPEEIDEHNILGATKRAMLKAYEGLSLKPDIALVDGNQLPKLPCKMQAVVGGDGLCISIAAASIVAKVTRDRMMAEIAKEFPHYGWEHNAGYGTAKHQEGLAQFGVTPYHRRSFAPIRKLLEAS